MDDNGLRILPNTVYTPAKSKNYHAIGSKSSKRPEISIDTNLAQRRRYGLPQIELKAVNEPDKSPLTAHIWQQTRTTRNVSLSAQTPLTSSTLAHGTGRLHSIADNCSITPTIIVTPAEDDGYAPFSSRSSRTVRKPRARSSVYSRATYVPSPITEKELPPLPAISAPQSTHPKRFRNRTSFDRRISHVKHYLRDSNVTIFDEDEDEETHFVRPFSNFTIFEEDGRPKSKDWGQIRTPDRYAARLSQQLPRRSCGWWNHVTSPFPTGSKTEVFGKLFDRDDGTEDVTEPQTAFALPSDEWATPPKRSMSFSGAVHHENSNSSTPTRISTRSLKSDMFISDNAPSSRGVPGSGSISANFEGNEDSASEAPSLTDDDGQDFDEGFQSEVDEPISSEISRSPEEDMLRGSTPITEFSGDEEHQLGGDDDYSVTPRSMRSARAIDDNTELGFADDHTPSSAMDGQPDCYTDSGNAGLDGFPLDGRERLSEERTPTSDGTRIPSALSDNRGMDNDGDYYHNYGEPDIGYDDRSPFEETGSVREAGLSPGEGFCEGTGSNISSGPPGFIDDYGDGATASLYDGPGTGGGATDPAVGDTGARHDDFPVGEDDGFCDYGGNLPNDNGFSVQSGNSGLGGDTFGAPGYQDEYASTGCFAPSSSPVQNEHGGDNFYNDRSGGDSFESPGYQNGLASSDVFAPSGSPVQDRYERENFYDDVNSSDSFGGPGYQDGHASSGESAPNDLMMETGYGDDYCDDRVGGDSFEATGYQDGYAPSASLVQDEFGDDHYADGIDCLRGQSYLGMQNGENYADNDGGYVPDYDGSGPMHHDGDAAHQDSTGYGNEELRSEAFGGFGSEPAFGSADNAYDGAAHGEYIDNEGTQYDSFSTTYMSDQSPEQYGSYSGGYGTASFGDDVSRPPTPSPSLSGHNICMEGFAADITPSPGTENRSFLQEENPRDLFDDYPHDGQAALTAMQDGEQREVLPFGEAAKYYDPNEEYGTEKCVEDTPIRGEHDQFPAGNGSHDQENDPDYFQSPRRDGGEILSPLSQQTEATPIIETASLGQYLTGDEVRRARSEIDISPHPSPRHLPEEDITDANYGDDVQYSVRYGRAKDRASRGCEHKDEGREGGWVEDDIADVPLNYDDGDNLERETPGIHNTPEQLVYEESSPGRSRNRALNGLKRASSMCCSKRDTYRDSGRCLSSNDYGHWERNSSYSDRTSRRSCFAESRRSSQGCFPNADCCNGNRRSVRCCSTRSIKRDPSISSKRLSASCFPVREDSLEQSRNPRFAERFSRGGLSMCGYEGPKRSSAGCLNDRDRSRSCDSKSSAGCLLPRKDSQVRKSRALQPSPLRGEQPVRSGSSRSKLEALREYLRGCRSEKNSDSIDQRGVNPSTTRFRMIPDALLGIACLLTIGIIVTLVMLVHQKHKDTPIQAQWLNLTGFPPMPTGISTVARPKVVRQESSCVKPASIWSCAVSKEQQSAVSDKPNQPNFRLEVLFKNNSVGNSSSLQPSKVQMASIDKRAYNPMTAGALVKRANLVVRDAFNDIVFTPNPASPKAQEQIFLGNTTDNNTAPYDGEPTPFFIFFLNATNLFNTNVTDSHHSRRSVAPIDPSIIYPPTNHDSQSDSSQVNGAQETGVQSTSHVPTSTLPQETSALSASSVDPSTVYPSTSNPDPNNGQSGDVQTTTPQNVPTATAASAVSSSETTSSSSFANQATNIPEPATLSHGSPAPAQLLPLPQSQPLRLYNRGQETEHYGFYTYFDRSIFLTSISLVNSSSPSTHDLSSAISSGDPSGGVAVQDAKWMCTWAQTRFKVAIWTRRGNRLLHPSSSEILPSSTLSNSSSQTKAKNSSANDFEGSGSFPYPVTITLDRHGGDASSKGLYCYEMEDGKVLEHTGIWVAEDRSSGGSLVNPGVVPGSDIGKVKRDDDKDSGDAGEGGIDGGTGGCACAWENFAES
ncbi:MAG: hypothetical protein M1820_010676 [Bogoriella megaspora]|nr:MAG: hypothetical protein M1820_010676 [Bogoriella megaspora]